MELNLTLQRKRETSLTGLGDLGLFFFKNSGRDIGTLAQLKNILNWSSVPCSPQKDVHTAEDFFLSGT